MQENEMLQCWKTLNLQLEKSLVLNRQNTIDITAIKVAGQLGSMKPIKIFTLLTGLVWVGVGSVVVFHLSRYALNEISKFFLFSATLQLLLTALALVLYAYQLVLLQQVDASGPVLATQEKLVQLKHTTLWIARLLFLQLPLWTTFYLSDTIFTAGNIGYLLVNSAVTLVFAGLAAWLFLHIKFENRNKRWFRLIFDGREWTPLLRSFDLLEQLQELKREEYPNAVV